MFVESVQHPLSQERLSPDETGYKSGIPPDKSGTARSRVENTNPLRHQFINSPFVLVLVKFFDKYCTQSRKINHSSRLNSNSN